MHELERIISQYQSVFKGQKRVSGPGGDYG